MKDSLLNQLLRLLGKGGRARQDEVTLQNDGRYPLGELAKHVGERLLVYYVSQDVPQPVIERILEFPPSQEFFYLGTEGYGRSYSIFYWDRRDPQGRRYAVRSIRLANNRLIYENPDVPWDAEKSLQEKRESGGIQPSPPPEGGIGLLV